MPRPPARHRLRVSLYSDGRGGIKDARSILDMLRHEHATIETLAGTDMVLCMPNPPTTGRWASMGLTTEYMGRKP